MSTPMLVHWDRGVDPAKTVTGPCAAFPVSPVTWKSNSSESSWLAMTVSEDSLRLVTVGCWAMTVSGTRLEAEGLEFSLPE